MFSVTHVLVLVSPRIFFFKSVVCPRFNWDSGIFLFPAQSTPISRESADQNINDTAEQDDAAKQDDAAEQDDVAGEWYSCVICYSILGPNSGWFYFISSLVFCAMDIFL